MREEIARSGILSSRVTAAEDALKSAGTIGKASSPGKIENQASKSVQSSLSGAPVFLASAKLRSTWCDLSESRTEAPRRAAEAEKESHKESRPSRDLNVTGGAALSTGLKEPPAPSNIREPAFTHLADKSLQGAGTSKGEIDRNVSTLPGGSSTGGLLTQARHSDSPFLSSAAGSGNQLLTGVSRGEKQASSDSGSHIISLNSPGNRQILAESVFDSKGSPTFNFTSNTASMPLSNPGSGVKEGNATLLSRSVFTSETSAASPRPGTTSLLQFPSPTLKEGFTSFSSSTLKIQSGVSPSGVAAEPVRLTTQPSLMSSNAHQIVQSGVESSSIFNLRPSISESGVKSTLFPSSVDSGVKSSLFTVSSPVFNAETLARSTLTYKDAVQSSVDTSPRQYNIVERPQIKSPLVDTAITHPALSFDPKSTSVMPELLTSKSVATSVNLSVLEMQKQVHEGFQECGAQLTPLTRPLDVPFLPERVSKNIPTLTQDYPAQPGFPLNDERVTASSLKAQNVQHDQGQSGDSSKSTHDVRLSEQSLRDIKSVTSEPGNTQEPPDLTVQKLEKMAEQKLLYGATVSPLPQDTAFNYTHFAQNSLWDSLRLIWKTFLSSTEADIQEYYSPHAGQYSNRGEEKGQKFAASADLMRQDAVMTLPVRAYHESDLPKKAKGGEKDPGQEGAEKGLPFVHDEKTNTPHVPDGEEDQYEEGGGDKKKGGGDQKEGEHQEKDGKKDKEREKGKDGRREDGREKKEDRDSGGEENDDAASGEKSTEAEIEKKAADRDLDMPESISPESSDRNAAAATPGTAHFPAGSDEYLPTWDFRGFTKGASSARYDKNRKFYRKISKSRPLRHHPGIIAQPASDSPVTLGPVPFLGPVPSFPLFAQLYAETTSPFGIHQMPPPKVFVKQDILRQELMEMLEMAVLQPLRMTARASRFVASAIGDIIRRRYRLKDITKEYFASYVAMLMRISGEFTFSHSLRTMDLALDIAREAMIEDEEALEQVKFGAFFKDIGELDFLLSRLPTREKESIAGFLASRDLKWAGVLHDIGKIKIPREVLYKPGALSDEEFRIMKMHPIYSEQILYPVTSLRFLCPVVRAHHERWDGKGYPDRLEGNSIPVAARIIAIADVFDALISDRPYKKGMPWAKVKKIMSEGRGTHFDPRLLDLFMALVTPRHEKQIKQHLQ